VASHATITLEVRMRHVWLVTLAARLRSYRLTKWAIGRVIIETRAPGKRWEKSPSRIEVNRG
jgi:hypothetical protein